MHISGYIQNIQEYCLSEGRTIKQIINFLKLKGQNVISQLHHFFKTSKGKTFFNSQTIEGITHIRTNPLNYKNKLLTLICSKQKKPQTETLNGRLHDKAEGVKRASPERFQAIQILNRVGGFGYFDLTTKQFINTNSAYSEITELFNNYCSRVSLEKIVMSRAPDGSPVFCQDIEITYKTRFTDKGRQNAILEGFEGSYNKGSAKSLYGVFLTLTIEPRAQETLWQANRRALHAWDLFRKRLSRFLPERAEWICVREFQKNGRLHFHILIFGIKWLARSRYIKDSWIDCGGGSIIDIHTIRQVPGLGWQWVRSKPSDSEGKAPGDYLRAYLIKSMSHSAGSMYWATGVRAWTASKGLLPEKPKPSKSEPLRSPTKGYFLKGVVSTLTGFRSSHRKDSVKLFTGSLMDIPEKPEKPKEPKPKPKILSLLFKKASSLLN